MRRVCLLLCAVLLPLAGCHRHARQTLALPPAPPEIAPVMVSVPPPTHPTEPLPAQPKAVVTIVAPAEKPRRRPAKPRKTTATVPPPIASTPAAPPPVQTAAVTPPPINLGTLSAGGDSSNNSRQETTDLIHAQTQRIVGLQSTFVNDHKADVEQARLYLRQAQDAWSSSDVEAARTLATKAKVLLDDLLK